MKLIDIKSQDKISSILIHILGGCFWLLLSFHIYTFYHSFWFLALVIAVFGIISIVSFFNRKKIFISKDKITISIFLTKTEIQFSMITQIEINKVNTRIRSKLFMWDHLYIKTNKEEVKIYGDLYSNYELLKKTILKLSKCKIITTDIERVEV